MSKHEDIKTREEWNKHFIECVKTGDCDECRDGVLPDFDGDNIVGWHHFGEG